jgi:hypothetical protein
MWNKNSFGLMLVDLQNFFLSLSTFTIYKSLYREHSQPYKSSCAFGLFGMKWSVFPRTKKFQYRCILCAERTERTFGSVNFNPNDLL